MPFIFCALSAVLLLSLLLHVMVVMIALVFNNQVNNNFQYKLLKLSVALKVGFHNFVLTFHNSVS